MQTHRVKHNLYSNNQCFKLFFYRFAAILFYVKQFLFEKAKKNRVVVLRVFEKKKKRLRLFTLPNSFSSFFFFPFQSIARKSEQANEFSEGQRYFKIIC